MQGRDTAAYVASILNAAYLVRYYGRGARTQIQRLERQQAIQRMGLTVRQAFDDSDDFEALLVAIVDGLVPKEEPRF